jgi:hypothetical protein
MPVLADDDVVMHGNAERGGDFDGVESPEGWLRRPFAKLR